MTLISGRENGAITTETTRLEEYLAAGWRRRNLPRRFAGRTRGHRGTGKEKARNVYANSKGDVSLRIVGEKKKGNCRNPNSLRETKLSVLLHTYVHFQELKTGTSSLLACVLGQLNLNSRRT